MWLEKVAQIYANHQEVSKVKTNGKEKKSRIHRFGTAFQAGIELQI
jgi:hypothetical protein